MKVWQHLDKKTLKNLLAVARGDKKADLVLKNVTVMDLVQANYVKTNVALKGSYIAGIGDNYRSEMEEDLTGYVMAPGFIDAHVHIESSLMHPFLFQSATLPLGTTTAICDPHEITNVLGKTGFSWFLRCAQEMLQTLYIQVSSCIPSVKGLETPGATFSLEEMELFKKSPYVLGLAEMMNTQGVIQGDDEVLDKILSFQEQHLDGHAPLLRGKDLQAYRVAGIENCHETVCLHEAKEKLQTGMSVILREGSAAKNLDDLAPIINTYTSLNCMICSDDRNPYDLHHEGHMNALVKRLMNQHGIDPFVAYRLSSYAPARHFNLKRMGLIAPGYVADFLILKDVKSVDIQDVYCKGQRITKESLQKNAQTLFEQSNPPIFNSIKRTLLTVSDFKDHEQDLKTDGLFRVIELIEGQLITNELHVRYKNNAFETEDVLPIYVVERHGLNRPISKGFIKGFKIKNGAIASSVAHDSHNLMGVGDNLDDQLLAFNTLIKNGGGFVVVSKGKIQSCLELPLAGLMSLKDENTITQSLTELKKACMALGITLEEPFLQLAFIALPVIPSLKLTDIGLVDVKTMSIVPARLN